MPYLTPAEINSHLNPEVQDEISRSDAAFMQQAIDAAIEEAWGALSKYDRDAIFAATGSARNPIVLLYVKDIAVWHFIQLSNVTVDLALRERRYELATAWLDKVQNGKRVPNLPLPPADIPPDQSGEVRYGSSRPQQAGHL